MHMQPGTCVAGHATALRLFFLAEGVYPTRPLVLLETAHVEVVDVRRSL